MGTANNSLPPLAVELVLSILETVHDDDLRGTTKRRTLTQCAIVCKAWAPICQALIFRDVALPTLRSSVAFVNAINGSSERARRLCTYVQSLEVVVSDEEDGAVITQCVVSAELSESRLTHCSIRLAFANILTMLPNVEDLRLFYYCLRPLDQNTLDLLRTIHCPKTLALRSGKHRLSHRNQSWHPSDIE